MSALTTALGGSRDNIGTVQWNTVSVPSTQYGSLSTHQRQCISGNSGDDMLCGIHMLWCRYIDYLEKVKTKAIRLCYALWVNRRRNVEITIPFAEEKNTHPLTTLSWHFHRHKCQNGRMASNWCPNHGILQISPVRFWFVSKLLINFSPITKEIWFQMAKNQYVGSFDSAFWKGTCKYLSKVDNINFRFGQQLFVIRLSIWKTDF